MGGRAGTEDRALTGPSTSATRDRTRVSIVSRLRRFLRLYARLVLSDLFIPGASVVVFFSLVEFTVLLLRPAVQRVPVSLFFMNHTLGPFCVFQNILFLHS